ncbi:MAG: hypothetical protein ACK5MU_02200 [Candidatus Saccharimonadales bacterium]
MSENVIKEDGLTKTKIDVLVDVASEGFIPDSHNQSIMVSGATEIFMIVGKPYDIGGSEYALVRGGEYDNVDLCNMMGWLQEINPELFVELLYAVMMAAEDEELDEALDDIGWFDPGVDIGVYISRSWLLEKFDEDGVDSFESELEKALGEYLEIGGHDEVSFAVLIIDDRCLECDDECTCGRGLSEDDTEPEIPWSIVFAEDYVAAIGAEMTVDFATIIDKEVVIPMLEKYGFVEDDPADTPEAGE